MQSAHHINDEAGAPGTGAPIVADTDDTRKSLQFDACLCVIAGQACLTCRRWLKHYCTTQRRRAARKATP